jgi:hypothetical protein
MEERTSKRVNKYLIDGELSEGQIFETICPKQIPCALSSFRQAATHLGKKVSLEHK